MRAAAGIADYVSAPVGRYVSGRTFVHFFVDAKLCGLLLWDRPDEQDVRALTAALEAELPERSGPHVSIVDARRLTAVDSGAFEILVDYFKPRAQRFGANALLHALVRPPGLVGAVVAGFWDVVPSSRPEDTRVFDDASDALRWLRRDDAGALLAQIDALHAAATGTPRPVLALRDHLAADLRDVSLARIARKLSVSSRTLQEQLRAAGTSFRQEVSAARVRAAQTLMLTTDRKLSAIALDVGCASLQHFSTLFRKASGETPSVWRTRNRPGS